MELRSCGTTHFIQTIRGERVIIVCNTNPQGKPIIRSKLLKDVYENESAKRLQRLSSGLVVDHEQVKHENLCFSLADRTLWEIKPRTGDEFARGDNNLNGDLDDDATLKQLKKRFMKKKRKHIRTHESSKQDNKRAAEDESDLHEPLINLKPKRSKTSKAQRKHMNLSVFSSSTVDFANKPDENLVSEGSQQGGVNSGPVIRVEVEIPDPEQLRYQNKTPAADASSNNHDEGLNPGGIATNEFQNMILSDYREPQLCAQEYQNCVANKILYDHVEDVISVKSESLETKCEEFLDLSPLAIQKPKELRDAHIRSSLSEDQNSNVCIHSRSSSSMEDISSSGIQVSDMAFDGIDAGSGLPKEFNSVLFEDKSEADPPYELEDSRGNPDKNSGSYPDSTIYSKIEDNVVSTEDTIADEEQPLTRSFNVTINNGLNCEGHIGGELLKAEEKQTSALPITDAESQSSLKTQTCDIADTISTPEPRLHPENLLSSRKVISLSSQERLRMAVDSVEIWNNPNQNIVSECKGKLFEKQTTKKTSSLRSEIQYDKVTINHRQPDKVRQQKVIITPRHNIKKSLIPKSNLEGPRCSRTLPNLNTECTSIQSCSKSAIAFSKQQMYDMESLVVKLMNELKSMKDIVEQKLLFEAYRNVSMKNDADEVKSAIKNASKVEETSRKWLSIMARDCNRFCKIMKMTPNTASVSKDTVRRERRKIIFADEAGGKLCHVKLLEDGMTSQVSDGVKQ